MLDAIDDPRDLRTLGEDQLDRLAAEIRAELVERVCAAGGHLRPNLLADAGLSGEAITQATISARRQTPDQRAPVGTP